LSLLSFSRINVEFMLKSGVFGEYKLVCFAISLNEILPD
jgi:hypothetical protein